MADQVFLGHEQGLAQFGESLDRALRGRRQVCSVRRVTWHVLEHVREIE